jgi:ankyrin repeat protein
VLHGWRECIQLLLDGGAEVTMDIENMTALHYTTRMERPELAKAFLNAGISVDTHVKRKFWTCRHNGNQRVWEFNDDPQLAQVNRTHEAGLTPLHYAVLTGSETMTKFLLQEGANVNARSQYGETPLHLALKQNVFGPEWQSGHEDSWNAPHFRIDYAMDLIDLNTDNEEDYDKTQEWVELQHLNVFVTLLDNADTDLTCKDVFGTGLLHSVRYRTGSSVTVLERLLAKGIPVDLRNSKGQTALHLACLEHDLGAIECLVRHGANLAATDDGGLNALHYAARGADASCMQLVLDSTPLAQFPAIVEAKDNKNRNALHHLVVHGGYVDIAAVQCLKTNGIDINGLDDEGHPPLARYLRRFLDRSTHKAEIAEYLFHARADSTFRTVNGLTLGHLAASADELGIELLQVLTKSSVDLKSSDRDGRTILHQSALAGSLKTRSALDFLCREVGLSISDLTSTGKTALDLAIEARDKGHHRLTFRPKRWSTAEELLRSYEL